MPLEDKRILFGHQSVGANILAGLAELSATKKLIVLESRAPSGQDGPCLFHTLVGKNTDPRSKIEDFVTIMNGGFGDHVDIACFKFCYIDIDHNTNVDALFSQYRAEMKKLATKFPNIQFVHITTPLRTVEPSMRLFIKNVLGKQSIKLADNQKRQAFNDLMIKTYANREPVFDLAKAESTYPNGSRYSNSLNKELIYSLVPDYTDDGGHLNKFGQQIIAQQFINTLEQLN